TARPASASFPTVPVTSCPAALPASLLRRPDLPGKGNGAGRAVGGWFSGIGNKLAGSAIGRVVTKGAGALGWMGKGAGRALS
ncbi:hypothetical protein ONJ23_28130, partial [Salmonella enterica subsp. enterica serovar Virginia]|nr:hypothetical protein [Salmonella enterica subsp. enterica serovar Virginia]